MLCLLYLVLFKSMYFGHPGVCILVIQFFTAIVTLYFVLKVDGNESKRDKVVKALQDIFELVTNDMLLNGSRLSTFGILSL